MFRHRLATSPRVRTHRRPQLESLESRRLMAVGIDELALANSSIDFINSLAPAPGGGVWATDYAFSRPTSSLYHIGTDGSVSTVAGASGLSHPTEVASGGDGSMWVVSVENSTSYRVTRFVSGGQTSYPVPGAVNSIAVAPNGDLWLGTVVGGVGEIAKITTGGVQSAFLPNNLNEFPQSLAVAPDGSLWFSGTNSLGHIDTSGLITETSVPGGVSQVVANPDGSVAFASSANGGLAAIGVRTTDGTITIDPIDPRSAISSLAPGTNGSVWFLDTGLDSLDQLQSDGNLVSYPIPTIAAGADNLVTDGSGGFYFTEDSTALAHVSTTLADPTMTILAESAHGTEGTITASLPVADFTTGDPNAQASDFQARVDLGSPYSDPQDGTIVPDGHGGFEVFAPIGTQVNSGVHLMNVTVMEVNNHHAVGSRSILTGVATFDAITPVVSGDDIQGTAGTSATFTVASFVGASVPSTAFTASIDWGDGTTSKGLVVANPDGVSGHFIVQGTHTYATFGSPVVTTTVTDQDQTSAGTSTATVAKPALATYSEIYAYPANDGGTTYVYSYFYTATPPPTSQITTWIDWGDGTATSLDSNIYNEYYYGYDSIESSHVYEKPGTYEVVEVFRDAADAYQPLVLGSSVSIQPAALWASGQSIGATVGQPFDGQVATFSSGNTSLSTGSFQAVVHWGDNSPDTVGDIEAIGSGSFQVNASHTFQASGSVPVSVTISRTDLASPFTSSAVATTTATVTNPPPVVTPPVVVPPVVTPPVVVTPDAPFTVTTNNLTGTQGGTTSGVIATFDDFAPGKVGDYLAQVSWGDGSSSPATVSLYRGEFVVFASHVFATAGNFTFGVSVTRAGYLPAAANGTASIASVTTSTLVGTPSPSTPVGSTPVGPVSVPVTMPLVVSARTILAKHHKIRLLLTFSGAIDPAIADNLSRYLVTSPGRDNKLGTRDDRHVRLTGASYDATHHAVTLTPKGAFTRSSRFGLSVAGQGKLKVARAGH